jgi:hypothetical protein
MLQPHQLVSIQLSADRWDQVLKQLSRGKHRKVNALMIEIQQQAMQQQQELMQPPAGPQLEPEVPEVPFNRRSGQLRPADDADPKAA